MRKGALLVLVVALALLALGAVGGAGATPPAPFVGTWWAVDPTDGSTEQLTFGTGGSMYFRDNSAYVCGGTSAFAKDTGSLSPDGMMWFGSGNAMLRCPADGRTTIGGILFSFTLQPDGSLTGSTGHEVWTRTRP